MFKKTFFKNSRFDFEVLGLKDFSIDNWLEICEKYPKQFKLFHRDENIRMLKKNIIALLELRQVSILFFGR